jgi:hypothetical protein
MPQPPQSEATSLEAVRRVEAELRAGGRPEGINGPGRAAVRLAAERAVRDGWCGAQASFNSRLDRARGQGFEPDWSLYRPIRYLHAQPGAPVIPSQDHVLDAEPEGEPITVAVIGDAHDSPHLPDKSRFRWLGAYVAEHQIPHVVQIGDWWTMDCFSSHTDRASFNGRALPTFDQDRDSFHASQRAFHDGLDGWKPKKDVTLGNHEHRAWKWDNLHPEAEPHSLKVEEAFAQWGWRTTPFLEWRFIGGVGFVHCPTNAMGKPIGGKTGNQRAANDAVCDVVRGDDHKFNIACSGKAGPFKSTRVISVGCAFPPGYIEAYASKSLNDWEAGVCVLTIWGGRIVGWRFDDMNLLRRRYGDKRAA